MAKTFLEATDTFYKIASSNTSVFGSSAKQQISLASDISNIIVDSNVDSVQLQGKQADYQFLQQGNTLKILQNNVLITQLGVQDDDDGSQLAFTDKTVTAQFAFDISKGGLYFDLDGVAVTSTLVSISNPIPPDISVIEIPIINFPITNPVLPEIPTSTLNDEIKAPFIYQSNNLQNLDSITALLSYSPTPQNGVNYANAETSQWRTRASSQELATDLTQTTKTVNELILQGQLDANVNAQTWYKIQLTQPSNLQVQNLSSQFDLIDVSIFPDDSGQKGLSGLYSVFDSTKQLTSYQNVPAGNYFVRVDKTENALTQQPDFEVLINTKTSSDFVLPLLDFDTKTSKIHAELPVQSREQFYKFSLTENSEFTLDKTAFTNQFVINLFQSSATGGYEGLSYTYFQSTPNKHIYSLPAGTYYLNIESLKTLTSTAKLDIPVISTTSINFNTSFENTAPNVLKADLVSAKPAISTDSAGNLELTYTFDLSQILGTDAAQPNATVFTETQKQAARLALQAYENIAKLKFRELPAGSSETAQLTFTNVSSLGDAAGQANTQKTSLNDFSSVTVQIDASDLSNFETNVGEHGYATLLHEIGHALGLKHPRSYGLGGADSELPFLAVDKDSTQYTLMSYNQPTYLITDGYDLNKNSGAVDAKTPLLYDIAAIQKLYGVNTNYNSGDTIYRWEKDTDPHMSIWDSGGIDTIDASNHSQKQELDLRAGKFGSIGAVMLRYTDGSTSLYAPQNNVSIAFDTIIENAIGSNQNDVIIGNSVANQLTGNGGRDSFVFASTLSDFNVDTITDFNVAEDVLILERTIFNALNKGDVLTQQELLISSNAINAENAAQRLIFNTTSQGLYYDADGLGGENAMLFALLPNVAMLNASQIFIQG